MLVVKGGRGTVVVNSHDVPARQRFTLAHELGHYRLHVEKGQELFHRDDKSSQGNVRQEIEANAFAAELLMPAKEVRAHAAREEIDPDSDAWIQRLATKFGVSFQAMSIRLQALGILNYETYYSARLSI